MDDLSTRPEAVNRPISAHALKLLTLQMVSTINCQHASLLCPTEPHNTTLAASGSLQHFQSGGHQMYDSTHNSSEAES